MKGGKILSQNAPGSLDKGGVFVHHVLKIGDRSVMFYEGSYFKFQFAIGLLSLMVELSGKDIKTVELNLEDQF